MEDENYSLSDKYSEKNFMYILLLFIKFFRLLVSCIEDVQDINQRNQMFIVEVIRTLAEFVVYAEKYRKTGHS